MAGPLSGIAGSQIPLATTFTPGSNTGAVSSEQEDTNSSNVINDQNAGTVTAETQQAPVGQVGESATTTGQEDLGVANQNNEVETAITADSGRGSIIDELV